MRRFLCLAAFIVLIPITAPAQDPVPTPTPPAKPAPAEKKDEPAPSRAARMIERFDENGDGKLAVSELPEFMAERLKDADTDGDGFISVAELDAMPQPVRGGRGDGAGRGGERGGDGAGRGGEDRKSVV